MIQSKNDINYLTKAVNTFNKDTNHIYLKDQNFMASFDLKLMNDAIFNIDDMISDGLDIFDERE